MIFNLQEFWRRVRAEEARIPDEWPHIVVLANGDADPGGKVSEVSRRRAAENIARGTHRLATPEETAECKAAGDQRARDMAEAEQLRIARVVALGGVYPGLPQQQQKKGK